MIFHKDIYGWPGWRLMGLNEKIEKGDRYYGTAAIGVPDPAFMNVVDNLPQYPTPAYYSKSWIFVRALPPKPKPNKYFATPLPLP